MDVHVPQCHEHFFDVTIDIPKERISQRIFEPIMEKIVQIIDVCMEEQIVMRPFPTCRKRFVECVVEQIVHLPASQI